MKPQQIASVIHTSQFQRHRNPHPTPSYPYQRLNSHSFNMATSPSEERRRSHASSRDGSGVGSYDDDFNGADSQHGKLLEAGLDGAIQDIDLDRDQFEREELKTLQAKDKAAFLTEVLQFYEKSHDLKTSAGRPGTSPYITAWPSEPHLAPVYVMMATAFATVFLNFTSTIASCCSCIKSVRKRARAGVDIFSCVCTGAHFALWTIAASCYHGLRDGKDLYSYSCSRVALARTRHFPDLDFDFSCAGHKLVFWTAFSLCLFNLVAMAEVVPVVMRRTLRKDLGHLEKLKV
ncbi:hypothetical protein Dda_0895 [Drechslerella dactyloides]|uniref:Uncharacterized protein n=1 Tax=Drechslerella dactyloides TaxID=74499 RepID=A0AAD6NN13_DREDA|nr:hypothetical protein Dda_0895 [Drechslerella dactyloides]